MNRKLYPNVKRLSTYCCAAITLITFVTLTLRLTVLRDMAVVPASASNISQSSNADASGTGTFDFVINDKISFANGQANGNIHIINKESNQNYMQVDIINDLTGKSVYFSGYIAPGTEINSAKLQGKELETGTFPCTAIITIHDAKTRIELNRTEQSVTIYVGVKPEK